MDHTAALRAMRGPIEQMQEGQMLMMMKKPRDAESRFHSALARAPEDYCGLLLMAKCLLAQDRKSEALGYAERAKVVYPDEPQADHVAGVTRLQSGQYHAALASFQAYEQRLPGNANTVFFQGLCMERMGRRSEAARQYIRYRQQAPYGEFAGHVQGSLVEWGYVPPPIQ